MEDVSPLTLETRNTYPQSSFSNFTKIISIELHLDFSFQNKINKQNTDIFCV